MTTGYLTTERDARLVRRGVADDLGGDPAKLLHWC